MQQVMFLEARKSKRSRKHNKKTRRTMSFSASWMGRGVSSDAESDVLGLELSSNVMEVSKQHPGELLKSFLRTKGVLAEVMVSLTAGHVGRAGDIMAQRFRLKQMWGPALKTKSRQWRVSGCLRGVVGFATFPRKVLFLSTVCTSGGRMVLSINRKGGGTRSSPTHVRVSKDSKRCWTPTSSTCASPRFWLTAFQSCLEKSYTATANLLIPATPMP